MRIDRRRVEIEDHPLGRRARRPRPRPSARSAPRIPASSASPTESSTRRAVETDAISPNSDACPANAARSETHRPPSASITARSQNTRPGSCPTAARACSASASEDHPQPQPSSHQRQQRRPRPRRQTRPVRHHIYRLDPRTSHHLQGEPPERGDLRFATLILPAQADVPKPPAAPRPALVTNRGSGRLSSRWLTSGDQLRDRLQVPAGAGRIAMPEERGK